MADILASIRGKSIGLDSSGNLVIDGPGIIVNNGSSPILLGGASAQVAAGSTLTLTNAVHSGKTIKLDTLTGSVVTLPAATGSGARFRFRVSVLATSNSHIVKVANSTDVMQGFVFTVDDTGDNACGFFAGATADTITLNRTTTGSVSLGEWIEVEDIAAGFFHVRGFISNSGTPATPFSATV
jgi:hypothetical protein